MSTIVEKVFTPDDLLTLPDRRRFELVDGKLVELEMSTWSSYIAGRLYLLLTIFCDEHQLGWTFPEGTSFQCFPDAPKQVRKPDASFIRLSRLTADQAQSEGHSSVAPDLAVEVLSPNDVAYEVDRKVEEYLAAGVTAVWVVNPDTRTVKTFRAGNQVALFHEDDEITEDEVLPGFRMAVRGLFKAPTDKN